MSSDHAISAAIATIKGLRRLRGGKAIHWASDIDATASVVAAVLAAADLRTAIWEVSSGSGASAHTINDLVHGRRTDATHWLELRAALTKMSVKWLPDRKDEGRSRVPAKAACVKRETSSTYHIDPDSQDIIVTTRLRYGTPEHRAQLSEMMLQRVAKEEVE